MHHFKKVNDEVVLDFTWTWEKEQNIINPIINRIHPIISEKNGEIVFSEEFLKDVSLEWNRDKKINDLINK
jgi:hypothetical protein